MLLRFRPIINSLIISTLALLFAVLSEGRFLDRRSDNCFYALRHRGTASVGLIAKMAKWRTGDMKVGGRLNEHDCRGSFAGCQTYSCIDGNGNAIFVVNACAPDGGNCTHSDLDPFCTAEHGTPECKICHKGLCNRHNIELPPSGAAKNAPSLSGTDEQREGEGDINSDDPIEL